MNESEQIKYLREIIATLEKEKNKYKNIVENLKKWRKEFDIKENNIEELFRGISFAGDMDFDYMLEPQQCLALIDFVLHLKKYKSILEENINEKIGK